MTTGLEVLHGSFETDQWSSSQWDSLTSRFAATSIYQLGLYAELHSAGRFREYSRAALFDQEHKVAASLQMRIKRLPFQQGGVADGEWGPLWENLDQLAAFLRCLHQEYVEKRKMELRLTPASTYSDSLDKELVQCLEEQGFRRNAEARPYHTVVVDLSQSLEDIRAGFHQKWRNQLNVAEKAGLQHECGTSDEFFDRFLRIYEQMWQNKKFPTGVRVPIIHRMHRSLPERQKLLVTIVKDGNTDLGATVCAAYGHRLLYFLGATMPGLRSEARPGYLLQWLHMSKAKELGLRWYDAGGYDDANQDIARFKKRMNGNLVIYPGQYVCGSQRTSAKAVAWAEVVYRKMRRITTGC
ncbi:MAG: GNAT family N-acetyltransferase [Phycisphaerae bacterium]|nr:GNAT family N-acetyltransferase [Phycisphaerae bacterium]